MSLVPAYMFLSWAVVTVDCADAFARTRPAKVPAVILLAASDGILEALSVPDVISPAA